MTRSSSASSSTSTPTRPAPSTSTSSSRCGASTRACVRERKICHQRHLKLSCLSLFKAADPRSVTFVHSLHRAHTQSPQSSLPLLFGNSLKTTRHHNLTHISLLRDGDRDAGKALFTHTSHTHITYASLTPHSHQTLASLGALHLRVRFAAG